MAVLLRARSHLLSGAIRRGLLGERGRGARRFSTGPTTVSEASATGRGATTGGTAANSSRGPTKTNGGGLANGRGAANGGGGASGDGAPANGGGRTAANSGGGQATGGGAPANGGGGGAVTGSGNGHGGGCGGVSQLRKDAFGATRGIWDEYNVRAAKDREIFQEIRAFKKEIGTNYVDTKVHLVTSTHRMVTAVGMLMLGCAIGVAPRIKQSVIGATAVEVAEDLKADQAAEGKAE
ncbi:glycine-rich protein DOT1-like [Triticum dicoccoides]|uniref:glycine-rich protein DOT1-like n=1 Tax=Triticum dicoccoides TaxID=85692 RepID=UPI00188F241E|nr:glycine-rich protein DOT1-like [Triticum dicoccoides]XP_037431314.1 glycine-rich protein DOT1-like [Triticum dicoccoides]